MAGGNQVLFLIDVCLFLKKIGTVLRVAKHNVHYHLIVVSEKFRSEGTVTPKGEGNSEIMPCYHQFQIKRREEK